MKIEAYLSKVFRTIRRFKLVEPNDRIFVALSGGKDSASALFVLKKYIEENSVDCELKGFHINFGSPISNRVQEVVEKQAEMAETKLIVFPLKNVGISLADVRKKTKRPLCSVCGVLKRYLMNKVPREMGATKVATGHHMDDFLVFFFKNILGQNFFWISKFKPKLESQHPKMLCKIRPLFMVGGEENRLFCESLNVPFIEEDVCPYTYLNCRIDLKREKWYRIIRHIEEEHKNFRHQMMTSIIKMSEFFTTKNSLKECSICGEPTSQEICGFCKLFKLNKDKNVK